MTSIYLRAHPQQVDDVGHAAAARRRRDHLHDVHLGHEVDHFLSGRQRGLHEASFIE